MVFAKSSSPWALNEPLAALLMCALHRSGRQAEALAVFDRTRQQLTDDLGVAPSGTLCRARRAILRGDDISLDLGQAA
ncbi:DNA-binding SARP family transcriptional activator [Kitasatospora sp. MAP12-15]|uniref:AfsR/SARP family transcriptional regulator n=1 Tax=unclassified Kitasatospora TaxID=2633591 RepID=UPI00247CFFB0|nr:DNA-binding SARP family transcriptional activator [Kitasatospora sp. MAP12-44]